MKLTAPLLLAGHRREDHVNWREDVAGVLIKALKTKLFPHGSKDNVRFSRWTISRKHDIDCQALEFEIH